MATIDKNKLLKKIDRLNELLESCRTLSFDRAQEILELKRENSLLKYELDNYKNEVLLEKK